ncbi:MAG: redoxin domain-containing protein [bacterium]
MYKPPIWKLWAVGCVGFLLFAGCSGRPPPRVETVGGKKLRCEPPGEEAKRVFAVKGSFKSVLSVVKGSAGFETKWQRIRQVSPKAADFDIIVWRLCEAYANQQITQEQYAQMLAGASGVASGTFDPVQFAKKFVLTGDVFEEGNVSKRVEGATVELNTVPARYTTTDPRGVFRFIVRGVDEGKAATLRVEKKGYDLYTKPNVALSESTGAIKIALKTKVDWFLVRGRVLDAGAVEQGVERAQVVLQTTPQQSVVSQSGGAFLLKVPKTYINKEVKLRVVKRPRYRDHTLTAKLSVDMPDLEIKLNRALFVFRATVVAADRKGEGLEGAIVTLKTDPPLRGRSRSDGGVLFRVPARYAGEFVPIRIEKQGYETHEGSVRLKQGEPRPEIPVKPLTGMGEYRKGLAAFREGDYARAVQFFARATQINPNLSQAHFDLGRSQAELSNWEAAARSFRKASDLDGQRFDYQLELAKALVKLNRFKGAMLRFERAAKLQPNNPDIYFEWARALVNNQELETAIQMYKRSISLSPKRYEAYEEASKILYDLGKKRDDSALVEESLKLGRKAKALKEGRPLPSSPPPKEGRLVPSQPPPKAEPPRSGRLAPQFTFPDLEGRAVSLAKYQGSVVFVNVWASWCSPCVSLMPALEQLYQQYREKGLVVVAVNIDPAGKDAVSRALQKHTVSFPVLLDPQRRIADLYPTKGIPATFIIDRQGRLLRKIIGSQEWNRQEIADLIEMALAPN